VKAPNELVTGNILLTKTDGTSGEVLAGAVFTLFNDKDEVIKGNLTTDAKGSVLVEDMKPGDYYFVETKAPTDYQLDAKKLTFTIDRSGSSEKQKAVTVSAENELIPGSVVLTKVDKHSAAKLADAVFELQDADGNVLQKDLTTDAAGQISITDLRPGTYQLVETKAPDYYQLLKEKIVFVIANSQPEALQLTAENELIRGQVLLTKTDADNADAPLAGAVFALQTADGKVIQAELTSDKNGTLSVKDLLPGDYRFVETAAPFGYDLDATPIPFTIAKACTTADVKTVNVAVSNVLTTGSVELTKVDRDNAGQPLAEVVFALQDANGKTLQTGLVTDAEGKILLEGLKPGNYQFVETSAPFGYDLDANSIPFVIELGPTTTVQVQAENELTTGSVELIKVDRDDETLPVAGAVFELRDATGKLLKAELTTDKNGSIRVTNLKPGDYQFVEIKEPFGYDLDTTPIPFTIAKGQVETLITTATNELTTGSVVLTKVDKHDPERVLTGAEFRLETDAGEIIREGLTTDKDGELHVDDLKPGNYRFIETKAPQHYQLDETPIAFTIAKGQGIALTILAKNELLTGGVVLTKVDATDKQTVLAGAHFELQDATGKTIQTDLVTDAEGKISISGLRPGDYQFVETQSPAGYQLDATPVTFTIAYSQETSVQLTAKNVKTPAVKNEGPATKQTGSLLPDTATDLFNYLLVGVLLVLGGLFFLKKQKEQ
jgi:LPXTG-motif cell wall-anchored protein